MNRDELKPGDVVWLGHDTAIKYTYLGEPVTMPSSSVGEYRKLQHTDHGLFAYNPPPTYELKTVFLPFQAVNKK